MGAVFLSGALGFAAGAFTFSLAPVAGATVGFVGLVGAIFLIAFFVYRRQTYLLIGVLVLCAACGMGRVLLVSDTAPPSLAPSIGTEVSLEGTVVADPDIRETHQRVTIALEDTKVLAVANLHPEVRYGETVRVEGRLALPEAFVTDGGRTFRYDRFLAKDGVVALVERAEIEIIAPRESMVTQVRGFFSDIKQGFLSALSLALPEPHASLAGGLVAGGKQGLGKDLLDAFIVSGLVHIVVLSGYNVMIVAEAVLRALSFLPRRMAATAAVLTIGAFVLAAGAGPASIRAGLMASIALFARATYRTYDALRALVLAGVVMLLFNPLLIAYDPGFQLSFVATLGLMLGTPLIEKHLSMIRSGFLREIASATIAAQIAVLPLLLYQNGLFSVVALPANLLVLPIVPLAMAASAFAGVIGFLIPTLAPVAGLPAYALLSYVVAVVEISANLPLAAFYVPAFPAIVMILAYAGLGYYVWKRRALITTPSGSGSLLRSS